MKFINISNLNLNILNLTIDILSKPDKILLKNINLITRKSLNNKIWLIFNKIWKYFYFNISRFTKLEKNYSYINYFYFNLSINQHLYDIYHLNNWIIDLLKPTFYIKCTKVDKKYKKYLKTSYLYKIKYLKIDLRNKLSHRSLSNFIIFNNYFNISQKILFSYIDLLLNYKNSKVYKQKYLVYNKIFKFL